VALVRGLHHVVDQATTDSLPAVGWGDITVPQHSAPIPLLSSWPAQMDRFSAVPRPDLACWDRAILRVAARFGAVSHCGVPLAAAYIQAGA